MDLVVGAVPGFMGYRMVEDVIKSGKDIVDISYFPEELIDMMSQITRWGQTLVVK